MSGKSAKKNENLIAQNKKARFDYFIEESIEAGLVLEGWEVKALRAGKAQLTESYVFVKNGEIWMVGAHITPLISASTHIKPDATRTRKLLIARRDIDRLTGLVERAGYTLVALDLHWTRGRAKVSIGLAKGKKQHDKRATIKERDWKRDKSRLMKQGNR